MTGQFIFHLFIYVLSKIRLWNIIYLHSDPKDHVCYYRDKKGKEIDFLLLIEDKIYPFEVKYQSTIKKSDLSNFKSFGRGILVTKDNYGFSSSYGRLPVSLLLS